MRTRLRKRTSAQTGLSKCRLRCCTGGRFGETARRFLCQQGQDEFGEYPTSRQVALLGWQVAEPKQRFESLEQKLDLPAQTIKFENSLRCTFLGQAGQQEDEFGCLQGARINLLTGLEGSSDYLLTRDLSFLRRQTSNDQAQLQKGSRRIACINQYRAACRVPFDLGQSCKQIERFALRREQTKRIPTCANNQISTAVEDGSQVARTRVAAIPQTNIARLPLEPGQSLSAAIVGQFEVINPTRQIVLQVQPPRCAVRTRVTDGARINHAQSPSRPGSVDLRAGLLDQPARNELQPIRGIAQATIQRWTRDFGNRARLRPCTASTQRIATCVDQRQPQQVGCALHPSCANKGLEFACRFLNRHELADPSQSRRPGTKPQRIGHSYWVAV